MQHYPSEPPRVSWAAVCARRLERHALLSPAVNARPADIVGAICGAHAQVLSAAELSIGLRVAGISRAQVREALWADGSLIKTYGPRGTVHLLPTRDLPMWTGALSALPPSQGQLPEGVRLTPEQTEAVVAAIGEALGAGELSADELGAAVVARVGAWAGELSMPAFGGVWPRWRQAMAAAANRGALCFGPNRGRLATYTSPRRWLPELRPAPGPDALAELIRRYLHAYGPATPQQFAQWLAVPPRWAAERFAELADQLQPVEVEGERAWVEAGDTAFPDAAPQGVRLLPYFDAYVVGAHPRERLFPGPAAARALAGGQAGTFPVLLVDGEVAGVWHQRRSGRRVIITVEALSELTPDQRHELDGQAARVGEFVEGVAELTMGKVAVGAHA